MTADLQRISFDGAISALQATKTLQASESAPELANWCSGAAEALAEHGDGFSDRRQPGVRSRKLSRRYQPPLVCDPRRELLQMRKGYRAPRSRFGLCSVNLLPKT